MCHVPAAGWEAEGTKAKSGVSGCVLEDVDEGVDAAAAVNVDVSVSYADMGGAIGAGQVRSPDEIDGGSV